MTRVITRAALRRWTTAGAATVGACLLLVARLAAPASADLLDDGPQAGSTGSGYQVAVTFTGNAAPGGGSTRTVPVRVACWWSPAGADYRDTAKMYAWYQQQKRLWADVPGYGVGVYGPEQDWEDAVEQEKNGIELAWYRATCTDPADLAEFVPGRLGASQYATLARPFPVGQALPPPLVRPDALAAAARDAMVIPLPVTGRNPTIDSAGQPTLVGLPTWFWVTDPAAVGGAAGERRIRAQVGAVWAEVTARTDGLQLSSPAGGASCPPGRATTQYRPGVPEASACTVEFSRASVAYAKGYPVTATTGWAATWIGSGGTAGGLDGLNRTITTNVPVAEVQNVVTGQP